MRKKRFKYLTLIGIISLSLMGCGNSLYEGNQSGYSIETRVTGISFDVPNNVVNAATAVTAI